MVNLPSRLNSRPPAPVECGGMTPLWNWETRLPVDRTAISAIKPNQTIPARVPVFGGVPSTSETRNPYPNPPQSRQKPLQSRLIVPNQGISRQTLKNQTTIMPSARHLQTAPHNPVGRKCPSAPSKCRRTARHRINRSIPDIASRQPPIKAKTPAIKADQASSRQTRYFMPTGNHIIDLAFSLQNLAFVLKPQQSRLIVPNQGISRQTAKKRSAPVPGAATTKLASRISMPKPSAPLDPRAEIREPRPGTRDPACTCNSPFAPGIW